MDLTEKDTQDLQYEIKRGYDYGSTREEIMALYSALPDKNAQDEYNRKSFLHIAASFADAQAIEYLLSQGVKANVKDKYNQTPLHYLAQESLDQYKTTDPQKAEAIMQCVTLLLKAGVSALVRDDGAGGNLCYHAAMKRHNLPFIRAMIDNKVKLDMLDQDGMTLLYLLVKNPAYSNVHSLEHSATRPESDREQYQAMLQGKIEDAFDLARMLMEYGIDPTAGKSKPLDCVVEIIMEFGHQTAMNKFAVLLNGEYDESDPDLDMKVAAGGMTIHQAVDNGNQEALEALLKLGADPNEVDTTRYGAYENKTPLAVAACGLHSECVKTLLDHGADANFREGSTDRGVFFVFATKRRNPTSRQEKERALEKVTGMLFEGGLHPNRAVDEKGNTPINLLCGLNSCKELRRIVFDMGVSDYGIANSDGVTPLMKMATSQDSGIDNDLLAILESGVDLAARDSDGNTALMYAAKNRNHSNAMLTADLLFSFGDPQPSMVNNEGQAALDLAIAENNEDFVKFVLGKM